MMKKNYIAPELTVQFIQLEGLIALSLQGGKADNSDALVKEDYGEWGDIWEEQE